jgi:hypothetical protein
MTFIDVERQSDKLNRELWQFTMVPRVSNVKLVLENYLIQSRPTTRHKWQTSKIYSWRSRHSSYRPDYLQLEEVPFPEDVQREALARFMERVTVIKGTDR